MEIVSVAKIPDEWLDMASVLTVKDIAQAMRVHENTVKNWVEDGKLPAFKLDRVIRIYRQDFLKFAGVDDEDNT